MEEEELLTFSSSHLLMYVFPSDPQTGLYSLVQIDGQSEKLIGEYLLMFSKYCQEKKCFNFGHFPPFPFQFFDLLPLKQQSSVESKLEYPALLQLSFPHLRSP